MYCDDDAECKNYIKTINLRIYKPVWYVCESHKTCQELFQAHILAQNVKKERFFLNK